MKERFFLHYFYSFIIAILPIVIVYYFVYEKLIYILDNSYYPSVTIAGILLSGVCLTACFVTSLFNKIFKIKTALFTLLASVLGGIGISTLITSQHYVPEVYNIMLVCNGLNGFGLIASLIVLVLFLYKYRKINKQIDESNTKSRVYFAFYAFFACTFLYAIALNVVTIIYSDCLELRHNYYETMLLFLFVVAIFSICISVFAFGSKNLVQHDKFLSLVCALVSFLLFTASSGIFIYILNEEDNAGYTQRRRCEVRIDCEEEQESAEMMSHIEEVRAHEEIKEVEVPEEMNPLDRIAPVYIDSIWPKNIEAPQISTAKESFKRNWYAYTVFKDFWPQAPFSYTIQADSLSTNDIPNRVTLRHDEAKYEIEFNRILSFIDKNRANINVYGLFKAYKSQLYQSYGFKNETRLEDGVNILLRAYYDLEEEDKFEEVYKHMKRTAAPLRSDDGFKQYRTLKPYISAYSYDIFTYHDKGDYTNYIKAYSFWGRRWKEGNLEQCYNVLIELQDHINTTRYGEEYEGDY